MLGAVGRDAQKHVRGQHIEEKNKIDQTGNVDHWIGLDWIGLDWIGLVVII